MANWTIKRIEVNPTGDVLGLSCASGETPTKVTLRDLDTANEETLTLCVTDGEAPCSHDGGVLYLLEQAGYTPNEWNEECNP